MTRVNANKLRSLEALQSNPTKMILRDLTASRLSPAAQGSDLERRYRAITPLGTDVEACMTAACRAYADSVGTVLVITDEDGNQVFGQVADPGLEKNDPRMSEAYGNLIQTIPISHIRKAAKAAHAAGRAANSVEYPVYVMPRHEYARKDGPAVSRFGDYLISYDAPVQ